jgi:hypothetical protein
MIAVESPQFGPPIPEEPEIDASPASSTTPPTSTMMTEAATTTPPQPIYRTHFERRSRLHQIPVYRIRYNKLQGDITSHLRT